MLLPIKCNGCGSFGTARTESNSDLLCRRSPLRRAHSHRATAAAPRGRFSTREPAPIETLVPLAAALDDPQLPSRCTPIPLMLLPLTPLQSRSERQSSKVLQIFTQLIAVPEIVSHTESSGHSS